MMARADLVDRRARPDHPDLTRAATVVAETPGHYIEGFALFGRRDRGAGGA